VTGKHWSKEDERTLVQMIGKGKTVDVIAKVLGKTENAVYIRLGRLGLVVVVSEKNQPTTTEISGDLPSVENVRAFFAELVC
jgi:hypothetical protein